MKIKNTLIYVRDKGIQKRIWEDFNIVTNVNSVFDIEDKISNSPLYFEMWHPDKDYLSRGSEYPENEVKHYTMIPKMEVSLETFDKILKSDMPHVMEISNEIDKMGEEEQAYKVPVPKELFKVSLKNKIYIGLGVLVWLLLLGFGAHQIYKDTHDKEPCPCEIKK